MWNNLYNYVNVAGSKYDVETLISLWRPTFYAGEEGLVIKTLINSYVPALARHYGMPPSEKDMDFPTFLKKWDEHIYNSHKGNAQDRLVYFARNGDWRRVQIALRDNPYISDEALEAALEGGNLDIIKLLSKEAEERNHKHLELLSKEREERIYNLSRYFNDKFLEEEEEKLYNLFSYPDNQAPEMEEEEEDLESRERFFRFISDINFI